MARLRHSKHAKHVTDASDLMDKLADQYIPSNSELEWRIFCVLHNAGSHILKVPIGDPSSVELLEHHMEKTGWKGETNAETKGKILMTTEQKKLRLHGGHTAYQQNAAGVIKIGLAYRNWRGKIGYFHVLDWSLWLDGELPSFIHTVAGIVRTRRGRAYGV